MAEHNLAQDKQILRNVYKRIKHYEQCSFLGGFFFYEAYRFRMFPMLSHCRDSNLEAISNVFFSFWHPSQPPFVSRPLLPSICPVRVKFFKLTLGQCMSNFHMKLVPSNPRRGTLNFLRIFTKYRFVKYKATWCGSKLQH